MMIVKMHNLLHCLGLHCTLSVEILLRVLLTSTCQESLMTE